MRDHLFISYADENFEFAKWLALKLTNEGYKVWCDKIKLLGGESYPLNIDEAIKEQTFRLIAVLSKSSINKPNPTKERTLALNIGKERKEDFLIPINLDGLKSIELNWMTSDLTYIPFHQNWALGLGQLLKKLKSIGTPQPLSNGKNLSAELVSNATDTFLNFKEETLWSNWLEINHIPEKIHGYEPIGRIDTSQLYGSIPCYFSKGRLWTFGDTIHTAKDFGINLKKFEEVSWENNKNDRLFYLNTVTFLLRRSLEIFCLKKGLQWTNDSKALYFPNNFLPGNKIKFNDWLGRARWCLTSGKRSRVNSLGERISYKYHLAFSVRASLHPIRVMKFTIRLYITDLQGNSLPTRPAFSRRKDICKNWWNDEWLSRLFAVISWIRGNSEKIVIPAGEGANIELKGSLLNIKALFGIDETKLKEIANYGYSGEDIDNHLEKLDREK